MPTPPHTGNVRKNNVQKFDARSGRLIWSRHVLPPFWARLRDATDSIDSYASAGVEIEPLHQTNDIMLRVQRNSLGGTSCHHALARVSAWGEVEWIDHIHLGVPTIDPGPFTPHSMAALANGNTLLAGWDVRVLIGPDECYTTFRETTPAGVTTLSGVTLESQGLGRTLFELPSTDNVIATQRIGRIGIPTETYLTTIENRTRTTVNSSQSWGSGVNRPLLLCASPIGIVLSEWRDGGLATNGSLTQEPQQKSGLVLRANNGTFAELANNVLPAYPPMPAPPSPLPPSPPTLESSVSYWQGHAAAVVDDVIYVAGAWITATLYVFWDSIQSGYYYPGTSTPYASQFAITTTELRLARFDTALNETWNVARPGLWQSTPSPSKLVADSAGCVLAVDLKAGRRYALERYSSSGELQWRQTFGSGGLPTDLCLSDDGYLFVAGSTAA